MKNPSALIFQAYPLKNSLPIEGLLLLFPKTVVRLIPLCRNMARTVSEEQFMAYLGSPLKHRLPRQGWRGEKLLLAHIHHNAHKQTLGNGKKMHSLCSTFLLWAVCTCSGLLEIGAISGDFIVQVLKHISPESQPAISVNKVKWLIYHNILHGIFSFHSLASMVYIHFMKTSSICLNFSRCDFQLVFQSNYYSDFTPASTAVSLE